MAKFKERGKAIKLRKQGMSYSQIKKELDVSKSTLSYWLRDYPLSQKRLRELRDFNEQRIEKFRATMQAKREARLESVYNKQKQILFPMTKRDMLIAGIFLYWGKGEKSNNAQIGISNSDPSVILFFIYWANKILGMPRDKMRVRLHLYKDMNIDEETNFWSRSLNIPLSQFKKPYIKESRSSRIYYKGGFGRGTCNIIISGVHLHEKIMMSIKCVQDFINKKGA